jgi:uncharacterized protein
MRGIEIGVISDTHDLLRPEAVSALEGVDVIVHAGDVCTPAVLAGLEEIAPVHAVRGNNDRGNWAWALPESQTLELDGLTLHVRHELQGLNLDPEGAGLGMVVTGHSHRPKTAERGGVIYLDPGSAGPRRQSLPICLARVTVDDDGVTPRLVIIEA